MVVVLPASRERERDSLHEEAAFLQNSCKRTQLVHAVQPSEQRRCQRKWMETTAFSCTSAKKENTSLHALRQHPQSLQQEQTPAQIAFNIQTLLNVQYPATWKLFFLEKLLLFFIFFNYSFSVQDYVYENLTLL